MKSYKELVSKVAAQADSVIQEEDHSELARKAAAEYRRALMRGDTVAANAANAEHIRHKKAAQLLRKKSGEPGDSLHEAVVRDLEDYFDKIEMKTSKKAAAKKEAQEEDSGIKGSQLKFFNNFKEETEQTGDVMSEAKQKTIGKLASFKKMVGCGEPSRPAMKTVKEEVVELDERDKANALKRKMMDASRGARYKAQGNPVPDAEPQHKTPQAHNKAIGRALRKEEVSSLAEEMRSPSDDEYNKVSTHAKTAGVKLDSIGVHKKTGDIHWGGTSNGKQVTGILKKEEQELEGEQLQELKKSTLGSYIKKASADAKYNGYNAGFAAGDASARARRPGEGMDAGSDIDDKAHKRLRGIAKATDRLTKESVELDEAVKTGNPGRGYHGEHESGVADSAYAKAHSMVKKVAGEAGHMKDVKKPNKMVTHYLDSVHGRHLKGNENAEYIKKDFGKFKKTYKPELHESVLDEEGNFSAPKISYKDFMETLAERAQYVVKATHSQTGRVKVSNYVADKDESERDVHDRAARDHRSSGYSVDSVRRKDVEAHGEGDEETTSTTTPQKRGRGRPAGSKSGARGPRIK